MLRTWRRKPGTRVGGVRKQAVISTDEHKDRLVSGKLVSCISDVSDVILLHVGRPPASTIDSIPPLCCRSNVLRTDMIFSSGGILCALISQYTLH